MNIDQVATLEEQEEILMVAEGLIREPANWTRGQWKCPAYETSKRDKKGRFTSGQRDRKKDSNGEPMFQYCVEGAVNEATLRVLGKERAQQLGYSTRGPDPTNLLGLNEISKKLYGIERAMGYNDSPDSTHEGVIRILKEGLRKVRGRMKRSI